MHFILVGEHPTSGDRWYFWAGEAGFQASVPKSFRRTKCLRCLKHPRQKRRQMRIRVVK